MSHETGKIEIMAVDERYIYTRYHRAKSEDLRGRFMIFRRNEDAYWLDDLEPAEGFPTPPLAPTDYAAVDEGPE
jgi:hypothetical protein